ncbi:sensor histidine kinase [Christensenella timonensis]|uniref:sensor histidine kinase n=1 Tax=Christensenella timonensis TaxID=1816678 RepID=UPI0009ED08D0|nr:HAMP domain-containing sensor histidine kinase [Christensenella timonensis]
MKKLSLRMRLTLFTMLLLVGVSVIFTLSTIYNAQFSYVVPYLDSDIDFKELEVSGNIDSSVTASQAASADVPDEAGGYELYTPDQMAAMTVMSSSTAQFNSISLWIMLAIILGGGLLTYFLLGRALKPVRDLSARIEGITEHELSLRVDEGKARDEISSLAHSFNTMLSRLAKAFSGRKRFASDAAHELKTPLAAIKANIDVLQLSGDPTAEEYRRTIRVVQKQTSRMIRLVDDLFAISSQRDYDFSDAVDFDSLFSDITAQLAPRIAEKKLSVHIEPGGLVTTGNSVMLTRAFSNLIENAVKYNVDGGKIDIASSAGDKGYTFTITDTGIGIPQEKLEHIFDPFYRADDSRSRKIGGAGLGLAIAKDIIRRHGGTVAAAPGKKTGTVFTVTLPRIPAE